MKHVFTSESVTEGHPDKVADLISDAVLDACLEADPASRVAVETLVKGHTVILAGEVTTRATVDYARVAREAVRSIGYTDPAEPFFADGLQIQVFITEQAPEIGRGVDAAGAGDQGIMFGYATNETEQLMPLPIALAHALSKGLAEDRELGRVPWLRPDGKSQVSVEYDDGRPVRVTSVLVSTQHARSVSRSEVADYVASDLVPRSLGAWMTDRVEVLVNTAGTFVEGGPAVDAGLTGRKTIVDSYGGMARHGGGAFSGKDPSKVDRSGAYYCRYAARRILQEGLAERAELQVAYAIGRAEPVSVYVETFGTGDPAAAADFVRSSFDFQPAAVIAELDLLRPIYRRTTNYGHFGRPGLPWEARA